MLISAYENWKNKYGFSYPYTHEEDLFGIFYQHYTFGKSFMSLFDDLAYQLYQLQVCMEGIIEDLMEQQQDNKMDKQIRKIEKKIKKDTKGEEKSIKKLEMADKKRDKIVAIGKKAMKKGC